MIAPTEEEVTQSMCGDITIFACAIGAVVGWFVPVIIRRCKRRRARKVLQRKMNAFCAELEQYQKDTSSAPAGHLPLKGKATGDQ